MLLRGDSVKLFSST